MRPAHTQLWALGALFLALSFYTTAYTRARALSPPVSPSLSLSRSLFNSLFLSLSRSRSLALSRVRLQEEKLLSLVVPDDEVEIKQELALIKQEKGVKPESELAGQP